MVRLEVTMRLMAAAGAGLIGNSVLRVYGLSASTAVADTRLP